MTWQLLETTDIESIGELYAKVFKEFLAPETITEKELTHRIHYYLVKDDEGTVAGFAIFLGKEREVELWHAGISGLSQNKGAGKTLLDQGVRTMGELGYTRMTVCTFNRWDKMLGMLIRRGFRIIGTEFSVRHNDVKIILQAEITPKKEIRYAITEQCNFNCRFCHNEGLGHIKRGLRPVSEIIDVLAQAVQAGYTDITLTGGEPLFGGRKHKARLYEILNSLGTLTKPPSITLVTNGSCLTNDDIVKLLDYPGSKKLHVSLHATDEDNFKDITGVSTEGLFGKIKSNIRSATNAGIQAKVNCVLLQGINHNKIKEAVDNALEMGASAIKFLDLLVLPDSAEDLGLYYDSDAILPVIEKFAIPMSSNNRRKQIFSYKYDSEFKIEVQKLTCALGCIHCRELRDRTFSSDMCYHPCFVREKTSYRIDDSLDLDTALKQGDRIIDGNAFQYKDTSPTIIKKKNYIAGIREFFYRIDSVSEFKSFLRSNGYNLIEKKKFHREYFWPCLRTPEWENFEKTLKIGWDFHDQSNVRMIYADHKYSANDAFGLEVITQYLDSKGPQIFQTPDLARNTLVKLGFECYAVSDFDLEIYNEYNLNYSVLISDSFPVVKLTGNDEEMRLMLELVQSYKDKFMPLLQPVEEFMQLGRNK